MKNSMRSFSVVMCQSGEEFVGCFPYRGKSSLESIIKLTFSEEDAGEE